MVQRLQEVRGSITEDSINTYKNAKVEVPNSQGAKTVTLVQLYMDADVAVPASGGVGYNRYAVAVGDQTSQTSMRSLQHSGVVGFVEEIGQLDASGDYLYMSNSSPTLFRTAKPIPRDPDGKFYLTQHIAGSGNNTGETMDGEFYAEVIVTT